MKLNEASLIQMNKSQKHDCNQVLKSFAFWRQD